MPPFLAPGPFSFRVTSYVQFASVPGPLAPGPWDPPQHSLATRTNPSGQPAVTRCSLLAANCSLLNPLALAA